ncbi:hypothetical protein GCM10009110_23470 [Psychrobacter piscatorii]
MTQSKPIGSWLYFIYIGQKPKFQVVTLFIIATLFMAFAYIAAVLTHKCLSIDSDDGESQSFDE